MRAIAAIDAAFDAATLIFIKHLFTLAATPMMLLH